MKYPKKIFLSFLLVGSFFSLANAQGFSSFKIEGELFKANIKNVKSGPSKIEVIVGADVNLKKVKSKYALLSACQMDGKIKDDFTSPQKVQVYKAADTKDWIIQVKKLQPAKLPLELKFSNANPSVYDSSVVGWATLGTDESKPGTVRMGNSDVFFVIAFEGEAKQVSYDLQKVGTDDFSGVIDVETSTDGKKWTLLVKYNKKNPIATDSNFSNELSPDVRFIKWAYKEREKQNVNLNNIIVSPR